MPFRTYSGWRISVASGSIVCPGVDHFLLVIDINFPLSQPCIIAPQADSDYSWPHIEKSGLLCLKNTKVNADPAERLLQHIIWAKELLNLPEYARRSEFEREFCAYWGQRVSNTSKCPSVLSLLVHEGPSREIIFFVDGVNDRVVVAEDRTSLKGWLRHNSFNPPDKKILSSWLEWLPQPWIPKDFPEKGFEVIKYIPEDIARA